MGWSIERILILLLADALLAAIVVNILMRTVL